MSRSCVYLTNEHPFYMLMTANSLSMLRRHNASIPVRLFFVEDSLSSTLRRPGVWEGAAYDSGQLFRLCDELDVEICRRPLAPFPGEEGFFLIQKYHAKDAAEDSVLYIDCDTFVFGDVESLFEKYRGVDLAACANGWVYSYGYDAGYLPMMPFNSGVMLWNRGHGSRFFSELPVWCRILRERRHRMADWLYSVHGDCAHREEFAVSLFVEAAGLSYAYFDQHSDVTLIGQETDYRWLGRSVIFHTFTQQWRTAYRLLYRSKPVRDCVKRKRFFPNPTAPGSLLDKRRET